MGCWSHTVGIRLSGGMRVSGPPWHAAQGPSQSLHPHDWLSPEDGLGPNNGQTFFSSAIFQSLHEAHPIGHGLEMQPFYQPFNLVPNAHHLMHHVLPTICTWLLKRCQIMEGVAEGGRGRQAEQGGP